MVHRHWRFRKQQQQVEQIFFAGLKNLCNFYRLPIPDVTHFAYPYSMYEALQRTNHTLAAKHHELQMHIVEDDEGGLHVGCTKNYQTDRSIYFIPVKPLVTLLKRKKTAATAQLVTSLMAWLHQIVDIPFYSDTSCYVGYTYQCVENMLNDAEDEYEQAEWQEYLEEVDEVQTTGLKIHQLINQKKALHQLETRVTHYDPNTLLEAVLAEVGKQALELYKAYPDRSYLDRLPEEADEERDSQEIVQVDKYLSFHWSWKGYLGEQLHEFLQSDTMEAIEAEEPQSIQLFDTPQTEETHDFYFEEKLFSILDSFIYVLNNLP